MRQFHLIPWLTTTNVLSIRKYQIPKMDDPKPKMKEELKKDTKLKIRYKQNEIAKNFLEAMGETALGVTFFTTKDNEEHYEHKIKFINHNALLLFRSKLRNLDYGTKTRGFQHYCTIRREHKSNLQKH